MAVAPVKKIRDLGLLESAVFRPQTGYYSGIQEEAAALMESPADPHPFLDGNKRVAFASAHTFLLVNGFDLQVAPLRSYKFIFEANSASDLFSHPYREARLS